MTAIELHPLCTLFPRMAGAEFAALVEDIKENGLRQSIIVHQGMILDGGNRYRACMDAGVEPHFAEFDGGNIVAFVLSANLHRRHMTAGQQAAIVASAQDWAKAQAVGKPKSCNVAPLDTASDRAAQSGASLRTQKMADKVAKESPDLAKKVAHGEISLPKAVKAISPQKPEPPEDDFDPEAHEVEELKDAVRALAEENDLLRDKIAVGAMDLPEEEKQDATEIIADLRQRIKVLEAELAAVKSSRDDYQAEAAEMKRQLKAQRRELDKLRAA